MLWIPGDSRRHLYRRYRAYTMRRYMWKLPVLCTWIVLSLVIVATTVYGEENHVDGATIGIDLGTTYSCVGVYKNGHVEILTNEQGNRITPSYVAFTPEGARLIGDAAKNQLTSNPENTIFDVKRLIGRHWDDVTVQKDVKTFPFKVVNNKGQPSIMVNTDDVTMTSFSPEEVSAMVLGHMKQIAERYLGKHVSNAVITVPAYFNDAQRQATKDAGTIAGLNVLRIINEPTAAAIAYGLNQKFDEKNVLVYDLGGGTFDVTLLTMDNGVFEVLAISGDTHLGGEDFDQRLVDYYMKLYKKQHGVDLRTNLRAVQKLRREVEKAKRVLSSQHQAKLEIEDLEGGRDFSHTLSRAKFEELNMDLFRATLGPVKRVLSDAGLDRSDVDEIVLVGGSTRIPKIQQLLKELFGGKEPSRGVNPDEAVAYGAAIQAGVLSGEPMDNGPVVIDVTPLTVGIETLGGVMTKLIARNSVIPTRKSQIFSTAADNQNAVTIIVLEGERALSKDNHLLGRFDLTGIPPAPRGVPQIEVAFEIDVNGILTVTAKNLGTSESNKITITSEEGRLSQEDIDRMVEEAERFNEEDQTHKQRVEARNELESYTYSLRNQLNDPDKLAQKLSTDDKQTLEEATAKTIEWLDSNQNAEEEDYTQQKKVLEDTVHPIISQIYQNNERGHYDEPDL